MLGFSTTNNVFYWKVVNFYKPKESIVNHQKFDPFIYKNFWEYLQSILSFEKVWTQTSNQIVFLKRTLQKGIQMNQTEVMPETLGTLLSKLSYDFVVFDRQSKNCTK